jgi:cell division protein FtsW
MCVAVGLIPVTGQPLPLISKGGTSTIINCIYIGMVLSVSRHIEIQEKKGLDEIKEIEDTSINKEEIIAEENLI